MRFATFNICSGRSMTDGVVDVDRFAAAIAALDADVLALQEVDRGQQRSGHADLTAIAAQAMGAREQVFAPALYGTPGASWTAAGDRTEDGPAYGCALLSRVPLRDTSLFRIPGLPVALPMWAPGKGPVALHEEPRVAVVTELDLGPHGALTVVGTHLPFVPLWNRRQLGRLVAHLRTRPGRLLLLGDLNLTSRTVTRTTGYTDLATAPTFPADRPRFQLDHVLSRGDVGDLGAVTSVTTPALGVSDHRPLVVEIELT